MEAATLFVQGDAQFSLLPIGLALLRVTERGTKASPLTMLIGPTKFRDS